MEELDYHRHKQQKDKSTKEGRFEIRPVPEERITTISSPQCLHDKLKEKNIKKVRVRTITVPATGRQIVVKHIEKFDL